ncbi:hypothetical protein HMPREF0044_0129 [Gleimia coleocanis DSM 15436]|uniref:Uncharacterized protein n=1 Tax=Gleimia coleocanis DSM 15436 TaxID=525245 RepID=C0VY89_9ACTO|nr:hypothetical protein [Gleimia coleocanis]EEH64392.1 hypothetical protein HMPREF0044_0129 [Gleimia coleocanis DSM 15436]
MNEEVLNKLTLGEVEEIENHTGLSMTEIGEQFETGKGRFSTITYIVYLLKRRENPDFTLEDARAIQLNQLDETFRFINANE